MKHKRLSIVLLSLTVIFICTGFFYSKKVEATNCIEDFQIYINEKEYDNAYSLYFNATNDKIIKNSFDFSNESKK